MENIHSPHFRSYTAAGRERTNGRTDWRELFDIGRECPATTPGPDDPPWLRLTGPNQWPTAIPELQTTMTALLEELYTAGHALLQALAVGLGQQTDHFDDLFGHQAHARLKLLHYPARPSADHDQGAGAHKDYGFLSMVLQDTTGGLEAQIDGDWHAVTPRPGTLVVNLGETLELATSGYLTAARHRVISPPPDTERTSIAFFLNPRLDAQIQPVPLPPRLAAQTRDLTQDPNNPVFTTYGRNELKGWLRAHPRVAERHYPHTG